MLVPLTALVLRPWELGLAGVWASATSPRVLAALRLSFGSAALAAAFNVPLGLLVAWVLFFVIRGMNKLKRQEDAKVDVLKAPEIPADVKLLSEIRDLLATGQGAGGAGIRPVRGP